MGLDGNLEDFPLADVLQLINMGSRTGVLTINNASGTARIWFERGQAVHAVLGELEGERAVYETFNWKEGRFSFDTEGRTEKRTIEMDCQNLIMEAVRRLDEWTKLRKVIPSADYVIAFASGPTERADNITLQAHEWKVLSLVNNQLTVADIARRTGFSEFNTTQILYDLITKGLLEARPPGEKAPPAPPPKTGDEPRLKSLHEFLAGIEKAPEKKTPLAQAGLPAATNVGILAFFINALLDNFDKPNGLYNAVRQDKRLRERVAEQAERYPQVEIIKFTAGDRIDVAQLDADVETLDDIGKKNLLVALTEVKEQIFNNCVKQSNKIAASRRYNKVLQTVIGSDHTPQELGLGSILEKKTP